MRLILKVILGILLSAIAVAIIFVSFSSTHDDAPLERSNYSGLQLLGIEKKDDGKYYLKIKNTGTKHINEVNVRYQYRDDKITDAISRSHDLFYRFISVPGKPINPNSLALLHGEQNIGQPNFDHVVIRVNDIEIEYYSDEYAKNFIDDSESKPQELSQSAFMAEMSNIQLLGLEKKDNGQYYLKIKNTSDKALKAVQINFTYQTPILDAPSSAKSFAFELIASEPIMPNSIAFLPLKEDQGSPDFDLVMRLGATKLLYSNTYNQNNLDDAASKPQELSENLAESEAPLNTDYEVVGKIIKEQGCIPERMSYSSTDGTNFSSIINVHCRGLPQVFVYGCKALDCTQKDSSPTIQQEVQ